MKVKKIIKYIIRTTFLALMLVVVAPEFVRIIHGAILESIQNPSDCLMAVLIISGVIGTSLVCHWAFNDDD